VVTALMLTPRDTLGEVMTMKTMTALIARIRSLLGNKSAA
jgi:hypothetical protein